MVVLISLEWMVFNSLSPSYSVSLIGLMKLERPVVVMIVDIAGDASRAPIDYWTLLLCHLAAQWSEETIDIRASSNHASICCFESCNRSCRHYDVAGLGGRRYCRFQQWVLNEAVGIWTRLNWPYAIHSFDLWFNSESIPANRYATRWLVVELLNSVSEMYPFTEKARIVNGHVCQCLAL